MRITDEDEDLTLVRRELAYQFLPAEARHLALEARMPLTYLIDFYGPQITPTDATAFVHRLVAALRTRLIDDSSQIYKLDDLLRRYTRNLRSKATEIDFDKTYQVIFNQAFPLHLMFAFTAAEVCAFTATWCFDKQYHALRESDIIPRVSAFLILIEQAGLPVPGPKDLGWVDEFETD